MNTPHFLKRLLGSVTRKPFVPSAANARTARKAIALCKTLMSERGEATGATLAREVQAAYRGLDGAVLDVFFDLLVEEFSPDPVAVLGAAQAYAADPSQASLKRLQTAVEAPRQGLFRRINIAPGGTATLISMRRHLLQNAQRRPQWASVESDLAHLLASWFNRGFLVLNRIDWRTSAIVLEKLIQYEAVHQIQGWLDLRRRLEADRRCYAFFHPALPEEPLIFIEVALTRGMSAAVQPLLDPNSAVCDPELADCAIFYSITNCQEGLRGISFGNFLIKQVAKDLGREFPRLKIFATLSPIPGFRKWLASEAARRDNEELKNLMHHIESPEAADGMESAAIAALREPLSRLCAHYLLHAKSGSEPLDPVARFHLGNGARLERLNWQGDTSSAGMQRSAGLMANYVYRITDIERNHEDYAKRHKVIASTRLNVLAKSAPFMAEEQDQRNIQKTH